MAADPVAVKAKGKGLARFEDIRIFPARPFPRRARKPKGLNGRFPKTDKGKNI